MLRRFVVALLAGSLLTLTAAAQPTPVVRLPKNVLKNLDQEIERLRREWQVPGLAVAVVTADRVVYARGFGLRDAARNLAATEYTIFGIASCSKSIGAATVCLLAQEGRINLDAPVHDQWPAFRLHDDWATLHLTPRDLLSHRWGVPRHDLAWYHAPGLTRRELVRRLRFLPPAAEEPRTQFHYSNLGYTALSQLVQEVQPDRATWETVTRRRILFPLGMTRTNFSVHDSEKDPDHARPYRLRTDVGPRPATTSGGPTRRRPAAATAAADPAFDPAPLDDVDAVGAAANINSSATDMGRWLRATLTDGRLDGRQLVPAAAMHATHEPQMTYDLTAPDDDVYTDTYGMGWVLGTYRGRRMMQHSGSLDGFTSEMACLPAEGIGVVVLANLDDSELPHILTNTLLDRFAGLSPLDWSRRYQGYDEESAAAETVSDSIPDPFRVPNTRPSHPLTAYAGRYRHPAYGDLVLRPTPDGHLRGDLHGLAVALRHYHYETFETDARALLPTVGPEPAASAKTPASAAANQAAKPEARAAQEPVGGGGIPFVFATDARGDISAVSATLDPEAREPLVFERLPDTLRLSPAELRRFAGLYGPSPREAFRVQLRPAADSLVLLIPGETERVLVPTRPAEFSVRGEPGILLQFVLPETGNPGAPATEVLTIEPDGVYRDRRQAEE